MCVLEGGSSSSCSFSSSLWFPICSMVLGRSSLRRSTGHRWWMILVLLAVVLYGVDMLMDGGVAPSSLLNKPSMRSGTAVTFTYGHRGDG